MIDKFTEKLANKRVSFEFAETNGNVIVLERRFNEETGLEYLKPTQETNLKHIDDLIANAESQLASAEAHVAEATERRDDLVVLRAVVETKLTEGGFLDTSEAKK